MNELFKTFRLAFYVCALPLMVVAVASAHSYINYSDAPLVTDLEELQTQEEASEYVGSVVSDADVHVMHALKVDADRGLSGRIVSRGSDQLHGALGLNVSLNFEGNVVASAVTSEDGQFRFENVSPGGYTFIATSPVSLTTFGVYVFSSESAPAANEVQLNVAVTGSNVDAIREVLNSEVESVSYSYMPNESELPIINQVSQYRQNADGSLNGRVVPLRWLETETRFNMTGNNVYLFNQQGIVAESAVDSAGHYQFDSVQPGIYDFVSFGPHGAAALSIEVLANDSVALNSEQPFKLASSRVTAQGEFGIVLSEPTMGGQPIVEVEVIVPQPPPPPVYGGGYGGGGGGYGGIGDFGGLIGAALAAWIITEAINNDDNVIRQPVVVPPVVLPPVVPPLPQSPPTT